jgi:hypothetical protein
LGEGDASAHHPLGVPKDEMLTRARIASATASASAAVDFGCCFNHMIVAFGIVYLFQIEFVARRARDSSIMRGRQSGSRRGRAHS